MASVEQLYALPCNNAVHNGLLVARYIAALIKNLLLRILKADLSIILGL